MSEVITELNANPNDNTNLDLCDENETSTMNTTHSLKVNINII